MGRRVREPVRRPARADRVPQLGQRARGSRRPSRRASSPRCCSRTRCRRSSPRATSPRSSRPPTTTSAAGPGCRPTTVGSPTSAPRRRAGAPAARRSSSTTSTTRSPRSAGRSEHMDVFGGILLPNVAAELRGRRRCGTRTTSRCGICARSSTSCCNVHAGSGLPDFGEHEAARAIMLIELAWFAHRAVWHLIFGGVLERHPSLRVVLTEQGTGWIPRGLETLDWFHRRMTHGGAAEAVFFGAVAKRHVDDAERVLPAQLLGRRELPAAVGERRCATRSASTGSCGAPTTRTPRAATRTRPRRSAPRSATCRPRRRG